MTDREITETLHNAKLVIRDANRSEAIHFVKEIIEQLNEHHGDSFDEGGFEFATLYFP
jgi:hypothetical protein